MKAPDVAPNVHLVDLHFQGQAGTIAAYVLRGLAGEAALIETGPTTCKDALLAGLSAIEVDPARIRDVVVTHIHLDHAGAAGVILRDALPDARVLVHPLGRPHLIDPTKLLRSATRIYGERMETLWGEVAPVPEDRVVALDDGARLRLAGHDVEILFTPGHAAHHLAVRLLDADAVITGDAAGVRVPGAALVNPPTVPPEFDLPAWERSIERLLDAAPELLLLTHFGPSSDPPAHLEQLQRRLHDWVSLVREGLSRGRGDEEMAAELRARDAAATTGDPAAIGRLDLVAGYGMSVSGIRRYLEKSDQ